jgi:hypothetical protein
VKTSLLVRITTATCAGLLTLTGCAGTGTPEASATGSAAASTAPSAPAATGKGVSGKELCDYLRGELPKLQGVGSEVGAMAQLTIGLFDLYDKRGAVPDGADIDTLTRAECADVRTQVLKVAGITDFGKL